MATDIQQSQDALEAARRRTATVLATVATGVVGLDPNGDVIIANPRASELLGVPLPAGQRFDALLGEEWTPITQAVHAFMANPDPTGSSAEVDIGLLRYSLQLASLGRDPGGVVLALNDITEVSRAERVLAWGEMAHQVAHEIKNPLTPIRLGMQHLRRVYRDRRADFSQTLDETSERILAEIDRLDRIARAFGRFAAPADQAPPLEDVDLTVAASEVVQLYQLAGSGAEVRLESEEHATGAARADEVKEVLLNLLENARNAGANTITVRVRQGAFEVIDDGKGIPPELLPRVFEPRFSATTSGAGLGLAIARRVVEGWGGTIELTSTVGKGTTVVVQLAE
jgi:nitrogen fixation/metabolism regulation signal transduction histidine kinase